MSTPINAAHVERVRTEIGYAVRTAAAHGYAKVKHGASREEHIDALIDGAEAAIRPTIRKAQADALRDAAGKLLDGTWPDGFFPGVAASARELTARATDLDRDRRMVAERTRQREASQAPPAALVDEIAEALDYEDDPWDRNDPDIQWGLPGNERAESYRELVRRVLALAKEPSEERLQAAAVDMWVEADDQPVWHEARDYWLNMARTAFAADPEEHE